MPPPLFHARRAVVKAFKEKKDYLLLQVEGQKGKKSNEKEEFLLSRKCVKMTHLLTYLLSYR
jgi:hypothetical protein